LKIVWDGRIERLTVGLQNLWAQRIGMTVTDCQGPPGRSEKVFCWSETETQSHFGS
jgi:hypothetical protein